MTSTSIPRVSISVLILVVGGMYLRAWMESASWLGEGLRQREAGAYEPAIEAFRRAESWSAPGLPHSLEAFAALDAISRDGAVELQWRKLAGEEAKRGLSSSRSFLDGILGRESKLSVAGYSSDLENIESLPKEAHPPKVNYLFQVLAQVCFAGWIVCVVLGIWRGFNAVGRASGKSIVKYGVSWALFFVLWLLMLSLA